MWWQASGRQSCAAVCCRTCSFCSCSLLYLARDVYVNCYPDVNYFTSAQQLEVLQDAAECLPLLQALLQVVRAALPALQQAVPAADAPCVARLLSEARRAEMRRVYTTPADIMAMVATLGAPQSLGIQVVEVLGCMRQLEEVLCRVACCVYGSTAVCAVPVLQFAVPLPGNPRLGFGIVLPKVDANEIGRIP